MRAETARDRRRVSVDVALRRIALGYRVVGMVWLVVLAAVAVARGAAPGVALATVALAAAWTSAAFLLAGRRGALASVPFLAVDIVVAVVVHVAPAALDPGAPDYFGGYPFAAVLHAAVSRGVAGGVPAGIAMVIATVSVAGRPVIEQALFYLASPLVIAWAAGVLRRNEAERLAAESALAAERAERVRAEERAETAAHLHDSVLQTLALLQRRSDDPDSIVRLARRQERELREWLLGEAGSAVDRLAAALARMGEEVEAAHDVRVEVVSVGDAALDERLRALVAAAKEAVVNAARHAGVDEIAVYGEAGADGVTVWVRDRGPGFDLEAVPADRRGVRESIIGRMRRHGGRARLRAAPGRGTEVELSMPVDPVPSSDP